MTDALVAFGANRGEPAAVFDNVAQALASRAAITQVRTSPLYRTPAVGGPANQESYTNGAYRLQTSLAPMDLHALLGSLENRFGRIRTVRWGPRTIDLDLILYGERILHSPELIVPHPRMHYRWFVLAPLADLAPHARHPVLRTSVGQMLARVESSNARFWTLGGAPSLLDRLRREFPDRSFPRLVEAAERKSARLIAMGREIIGWQAPEDGDGAEDLGASGDWVIVFDADSRSIVRDAGPSTDRIVPAVDCTGDDEEDVLQKVRTFFDSLAPPPAGSAPPAESSAE